MGKHWSESAEGQAHVALVPYLDGLKTEYRDSRLIWFETFVGMYADMQDVALLPSRATAPMSPVLNKYAVPINVIAPLVDTAESRITQSRPRPFFKTVGGSWSQQRKAKKLQKFADGIFDETKAYRNGGRALKDAALLGTGCVKLFTEDGKICGERVLISNILVDESLGFNQNPPEIAEVREVSRALLIAAYPKHADAINKLLSVATRIGTDLVEVYECWRKPIGKNKGRHVIVVAGATLLDKEWKRDYFPIIFIRWRDAPTGFYGLGLAQQAMSAQIEITGVVRNISKNLHLFTNPRVVRYNGSNITDRHITNAWGTVLECAAPGLEPKLLTPPYIVPPEVYQWFEMMYAKVFEMCGVSQQAAFATKSKGLNSGKAIRTESDLQSDRLAPVSQRYEYFYLDYTVCCVDMAEELHEEDSDFSVVSGSSRKAERLKWADVSMPKDAYTVQLFAANFLARTPQGIFDDVEDLMRLQLIDPNTARKLMDFPDLQQVFDDENAARDNFESQIEKILDDDVYLPPQPFDDLSLGMKIYRDAYNRARLDDVPESKQENIRNWITQAQELMASTQPPPAAPMPPGQQAPQMGGM